MEEQNSNWLVVGRFGRTHGVKGFITIISFTEPRDNLLSYDKLFAFIKKEWVPLSLEHLEITGKHILAKIKGYTEKEQVATFTNIDIGIRREQLPKLSIGEYYWHELIDMSVVNLQGHSLGKVVEVLATGSNDVLVVAGERRHLIPYLPDQCIININKENRLITVNWDEDF